MSITWIRKILLKKCLEMKNCKKKKMREKVQLQHLMIVFMERKLSCGKQIEYPPLSPLVLSPGCHIARKESGHEELPNS